MTFGLAPLFKSVLEAAMKDEHLYEYLAGHAEPCKGNYGRRASWRQQTKL